MADDYRALVERLAVPHRASGVYRTLLAAGRDALAAVRTGLHHGSGAVRYQCCRLMDHLAGADTLDELVALLDDPDHRVRLSVLHTLACERCKEDDWRPDEAQVLNPALARLHGDADAHVRAMAIEVVGRWVHTQPAALSALERASHADPSPTVRKKARWHLPGGAIHRRTRRLAFRRPIP
ncbi:MAG: HEAT repeat domain-containing protein [Caulobacterales bacterium]